MTITEQILVFTHLADIDLGFDLGVILINKNLDSISR